MNCQVVQVAGTGFELPSENVVNSCHSPQSGAESGAVGAHDVPFDADLLEILEAWPALSESIKVGILAMVKASGGQS